MFTDHPCHKKAHQTSAVVARLALNFKPKKYTQNNPNKSTTMAYPAVVLTQLLLQSLSGTPTHTQTTNCWNSIDSKKATNETKDSPAWPQDWRPQRQSQVEPGVGWKTSDTWGNVWDDEVFKNPVSWTSYLMEIHRPRVVQNQILKKTALWRANQSMFSCAWFQIALRSLS